MENSYKFFKNIDCKYIPCHETENIEDFNCMFCFCPLYYLEDCGGNYSYIDGIRNCSSCLIPHEPEGYHYIMKRIIAENNKRKSKDIKEE